MTPVTVRPDLEIGGFRVAAGSRATIDLPVGKLSDHTPVSMSVHVAHGRRPGPTLFVSAAIHGDEVIGVEIARRVLRAPQIDNLRGSLLVVPIVNAFGFLNHDRYLPDRRDLNRSFPGAPHGSLAGRLAHLFLNEVVLRSDFGIDLHSAAMHRSNLAQVRVSPARARTLQLADAFGAPVTIVAKLRDGSLRQVAEERGVDMLLFEGGEALRLDETSARIGASGVLRVMAALGMIPSRGVPKAKARSVKATSSRWARAPMGGLLRSFKTIGDTVVEGEILGVVADPFGENEVEILSPDGGVVIGRRNMPIVNEGDALFHVGATAHPDSEATIETLTLAPQPDFMLDEDEII